MHYTYAIYNKNAKKFYYGFDFRTRKARLSNYKFATFDMLMLAEDMIKCHRLNNKNYKVVKLKCIIDDAT